MTLLTILPAVLLLPGCAKQNLEQNISSEDLTDPVPIQLTKAETEIGDASNTFGLNTFRRLYEAGGGADVAFSPLSLSLALSMTAEGAAGDTYAQFADVLGWGNATREEVGSYYKKMTEGLVKADPAVHFTSANSFWAARNFPLKADYVSLLERNYAAESYTVDFSLPATLDRINGWCSDKTEGKIPNMLSELDPQTRLMLINALLFKAPWRLTWELRNNREFTAADGSRTRKDYLFVQNQELAYGDYGDFEYLRIPYGNGAYQMDIILPRAGKSLRDVLPLLESGQLSYPLDEAEVTLYLPKWSTSYSSEDLLPQVLKDQGLVLPFDPNGADFSGISQMPLYISEVLQKVQIDVTEKGTEFAAVTVVGIKVGAVLPVTPKRVTVDVNRPFAYAIREASSNALLLLGTLSK